MERSGWDGPLSEDTIYQVLLTVSWKSQRKITAKTKIREDLKYFYKTLLVNLNV